MARNALVQGFTARFGNRPARTFFSPGRVNLIGEYTDFNGGYVLPAAIDLGTYYAVRPNDSRAINIYSEALDDQKSIALDPFADTGPAGNWQDYVVGLVHDFYKRGLDGGGLDIFVRSDLPQSSGLSSSASFTTGLAFLLNDFWGTRMERVELARAARRVENEFVGVQCGLMDQFAVALGRAGHCIYLDCQSLAYELVPTNMEGYSIVIADSRVPRRLATSAYNARRSECSAALAALRRNHDFACLVEASADDIEACEELKSMPLPYKRARHVVSENVRVQESVRALRSGNLARFGELMQASHESLHDDFEVSCPELDILVEAAMRVPRVLGSRMTGAGFGGCTVSIVPTEAVTDFSDSVTTAYGRITGYSPGVFSTRPCDGVKRLDG